MAIPLYTTAITALALLPLCACNVGYQNLKQAVVAVITFEFLRHLLHVLDSTCFFKGHKIHAY